MQRTKKGILISLFLGLITMLCLFMGIGLKPNTASAMTFTTPKYLVDGEWLQGGYVHVYQPDQFAIYMYGEYTDGTEGSLYENKLTNWYSYKVEIIDNGIVEHLKFKVYKNGGYFKTEMLSGRGNLYYDLGELADGKYTLEYTLKMKEDGKTVEVIYTYNFRVDNTGPVQTLKAGTKVISSGAYTNKQIEYSLEDLNPDYMYYLKPGASDYAKTSAKTYTIEPTVANNGWWRFYAVDDIDNYSSTVRVYLDTITPVGTVTNENGIVVTNGGYTNKPFKYTVMDEGGVKTWKYKKPSSTDWEDYIEGELLSGEQGWYYFKATDNATNESEEYKVYYDNTKPIGSVYAGDTEKTTGSYVNAEYVKYTATDEFSGVNKCYVKLPNTSNYTEYAMGTMLIDEGEYSFYAVDKSGNQATPLTITLDKTKPTGTIYADSLAIQSGEYVNASSIKFIPKDNIALQKTYVKKPDRQIYETYETDTQFTEEGKYSFYTVDMTFQPSDIYDVTVDRKYPTAKLFVDNVQVENYTYTNGAHIRFESDATMYVKKPNEETFVEYVSDTEFYKPGKYIFYAQANSGLSTGYHIITIDRTIKTIDIQNVFDGKTNGDVIMTWVDGNTETYAPIDSVTINGKDYIKDSLVYTIDMGVYNVKVVDKAGNVWETQFSSTKKNVLTDTLQKEYFETYGTDNKYYSFSTYANALAFATDRENSYVRTGEWKSSSWDIGIPMDTVDSENAKNGIYYIYKKQGDTDTEVAYFTLSRLNAVINEYASSGINGYYYWEKTPATAYNGENLYSYSESKNILANSVKLGANIKAKLDGETYLGTVIETEGNHILTVLDDWGNSCNYNLIIIRNAPQIEYAVGEGSKNTVMLNKPYHFKDYVTVSIIDELDEMAMFSIYDEKDKLIKRLSLGDTFKLTESGTYTVIAVNHAGQSQEFNLIISRGAPKIQFNENTANKYLEITVIKSVDDESHLQTLGIYKSTDNGLTWELLKTDDYGKGITLKTLSYKFRTSGIYKVEITDEFRTGLDTITAQKDYAQPNPVGVLYGAENGGFTNGKVTFTWSDEAIVTLTKNGEIIDYNSGKEIKADGYYELTFKNYDGYIETYTFTIDTVAPEIRLEGASDGQTVNVNVKAIYTEDNLVVELYKNGKAVGKYVSGTEITADGQYRLVLTDRALNKTEVTFTIDKTVDCAVNVNDNGLSNNVIATANEQVVVSLTKNGEDITYTLGSAVTEPADYVLTLTDNLGNAKVVSFKIVEPLVKSFTHNFDNVEDFVGVTVNGEDKRLNYGTLELTEDGRYEIGVIVSGNTYLFSIIIDNTAPTVMLKGVKNGGTTNGNVVISEVSEDATVTVTKDGKEISYALGSALTAPGVYKVTVTDRNSNITEYSFTIQQSSSVGTIIIIVVACIIVAGAVTFFIIRKKRKNGM